MATVILASRLPNDLKMEVNGTVVNINGTQSQEGFVFFEKGETVGITHDVDKSFWDAWRTKYAAHPIVAGSKPYNTPFIYEVKSEASAKAQAKELKDVKTGLEQKTPAELEKVAGAKKEEVTPE